MSSNAQWRDAYEIAEKMYNSNRPVKRTDLDENAQLICSRNDRVFVYDPYGDTYSFRNRGLSLEDPVPSKCRSIADVDLNAMRKNTLAVEMEIPDYINMTPIYVVPPSTLLIFNVSQQRVHGLTDALESTARTLTVRPAEVDMKPGGLFLYRHKDGKLYRVMILAETEDPKNPNCIDAERRYDVAFLDVCQMINLKLKNLFKPIPELSLDIYPCNVQCARLRGIAAFRSKYIPSYIEDLRALYDNKAKRKAGLPTIVYKLERNYARYVIDFPSIMGAEVTESEALQAVQGYHSLTDKDPLGMNYHQISTRFILPLEYPSDKEYSDDSDCPAELPLETATVVEDCPIGMASMQKFLNQIKQDAKQVLSERTIEPAIRQSRMSTSSASSSHHIQQQQRSTRNSTFNESIFSSSSSPSFATAKSNSTTGITAHEDPTPKKPERLLNTHNPPGGWGKQTPTKSLVEMKEPVRVESRILQHTQEVEETPKKPSEPTKKHESVTKEALEYSPDGWEEESPAKAKPSASESKKNRSSEDEWEVIEKKKTSVQQPKTPFSSPARPLLLPQKVVKLPVNKPESPAKSERNGQPPALLTHLSSANLDEMTPRKIRKNGSSQADLNSATETGVELIEDAKLEDDVFEKCANQSETSASQSNNLVSSETTSRRFAKLSISSTTSRLMSDAQANFHDNDADDEKIWGVQTGNQETAKVEKVCDLICGAFQSMKDTKMENLREKIREHFKKASPMHQETTGKTASDVTDISTKSICPSERSEQNNGEDVGIRSRIDSLSDDFAQVPEALKTLADAFIRSIQEATFEKNRLVFITEIHTLEAIALKSSGDLERRFWISKVALARSFESAFD